MTSETSPYPEFTDLAQPRFFAMVPNGNPPFAAPEEIFFIHRLAEQTQEGAIQATANMASAIRGDAVACERCAVNQAPWPEDVVAGCAAWSLRAGHWFVAVPYTPWRFTWNADARTRGSILRIRFAAADEAAARKVLAGCEVRALLGRVLYIGLGESGSELGCIEKDGARLWHGL